jgi:hypothetical protein
MKPWFVERSDSMPAKQICVPMENRPGSLHQVTELLKLEGVNIRAISVLGRGEEVTVVRMMVDDPELASNALASGGIDFFEEEVIAVEVPDHPGGLHAVLGALRVAGINVQQLYSYLGRSGPNAILILAVDQPAEARAVLRQNWVRVFDEDVYDR